MTCPDGRQRRCFPLLCLHVCDHKEALKATFTKKTTCTACDAAEGSLHRSGCEFTRKDSKTMQVKYSRLRDGVLDEDDVILEGKHSEVARRETEDLMGCRFASPHPPPHPNLTPGPGPTRPTWTRS